MNVGRLGLGFERAPVPVGLWVRSDDGFVCADVNEAMCAFAGRSRDELVGATIDDFGGSAARAKRDMLEATSSGKSVYRDRAWVLPSGEVCQVEIVYVSLGPDRLLVFLNDVTHERAAEQRLRLTEDRYSTLVATANQGVWLVGMNGQTVFANRPMAHILDRPFVEIAGGNLLDYVAPNCRATVAGAIECPRDAPEAFEARFLRRDGTEILCLLSVSPMPSEHAREETLCVVGDMTAVQRERELRRATERRYRWMVETTSEGVWTGDREGRTTFVNEAGARMLGVDRDEIIGRPFTDLIVNDSAATAARAQITRDGVPIRGEFRLQRTDGARVDVIANVSLLRDDGGQVLGSLAMITDVTQMKREQADLIESRERFAQVFDEAPVGIAFIGAGRVFRGRFLAANDTFREMLGYSDEDLLTKDIFSVTHPDDVASEQALATDLFEHRSEEYTLDKRFMRSDGSAVWARFRAHVLRDANGAPLYALGLAVDISTERDALERVDGLAARARVLFDASRDAVFEVTYDHTISAVNDAGLLLLGAERASLIGRALGEVLVPDRLRVRVERAISERVEPTETTLRRADGSEFPAELRMAPVENGENSGFMLIVRNLGQRDRAEIAQRQAETRFERLFHDAPGPALVLDARGWIVEVNPAFCKLAGRAASALIGSSAGEVLADAGDAAEAPWQSGAERPGPLSLARRVVQPNGHAVPVDVTASLVRDTAGAPSQWLCHCVSRALGESVPKAADSVPLSYRERQVLGLLAHGHDGPAIAERLGLSPETVRSYANAAREKLGAKTRTEAVALAIVRGDISV